jgi:catechol 2,3-dioxygenase-like lactoylglutathione lyase family enzyme
MQGAKEMKLNSIAGVTYEVEDLSRTTRFYEAIGFRPGKQEPGRATFYVNWFFVTFVDQGQDGGREPKDTGSFLYIKVDDIEAAHKALLSLGMEPEGEPEKAASGNREFLLRDPDGYNLVLFQKK